MSKARLIITTAVFEGRSQADVARDCDVSKGWVSKLVARYRTIGDTAYEPRSRRPLSSPNKTPQTTLDLIVQIRSELTTHGLDAGRAAGLEAEQPNETWQSDFTHYRLATGIDIEIITWLDDHSRYALSVTAHLRVTGLIVLTTFRTTYTKHGKPASTLTDNGMVYTTRFAGGHGGRNTFETELVTQRIVQKNSRPHQRE